MNAKEKAELLKDTIKQLYTNEGRSISYIYRLLKIDRHTLSNFIRENNFTQLDKDKKKIERYLKSYKEFIISKIKEGWSNKEICSYLKIGGLFFRQLLEYDEELRNTKKLSKVHEQKYVEIDGETWKPVLGYERYEVSSEGRVRNCKGIITPTLNKLHNRYYVNLYNDEGRCKNFSLARLIAHTFCEGWSEINCTVNHKDGDTHNNRAENLEWVSQAVNTKHSYDVLNRIRKGGGKLKYYILYKNQYRFKTIASFARFLKLSETQTSRWLKEPEKHCIQKIYKTYCNDYPKGVEFEEDSKSTEL